MARLEKFGLDFWPCDVDIFEDEKIAAISVEFGAKGEAVVFRLLCTIYKNGYFAPWSVMLQKKLAMSIPGISESLVVEVVNRLVKWGFFDESLFNTSGVLTSKAIQERYFEAKKRSKKIETDEYLLLPLPEGFSCKNVTKCCNNVTIIPQSISLSIRDNNSPLVDGEVISSSSLELRAKAFYNSLIPYLEKYGKVMLRDFYNYWSEPNKSRTKMRFELQQTWEVGRRLATWKSKDENRFQTRPRKGMTVLDAVVSVSDLTSPHHANPMLFTTGDDNGK